MSRDAMILALEALETLARYENPETKIQVRKKDGGPIVTIYPHKVASDAAQALHAALDAPREWVDITDGELFDLWMKSPAETADRFAFVRAALALAKDKNS
jgi:hypothetical protein